MTRRSFDKWLAEALKSRVPIIITTLQKFPFVTDKVAAHLKSGTAVIVEGKIKPETYTADGVEHKTFSIKANYIRKINYAKPEEDGAGAAAKSAKKKAK
jgi:hypothetical protein